MRCIAVCAAFPLELKQICRRLRMPCPDWKKKIVSRKGANDVLVAAVSGPGQDNMKELLKDFDPSWEYSWISAGTAGGLSPQIGLFKCLMGNTVVTMDGKAESQYPFFLRHPQNERLLFCSDSVLESPDQKKEYFHKTGADAVDMESWTVINHANSRHEPFAWIKVVSDLYNETLPAALSGCVDDRGLPSISNTLRILLKNPLLLPILIKMGIRSGKLSSSLAEVITPVLLSLL